MGGRSADDRGSTVAGINPKACAGEVAPEREYMSIL